MSLLLQEHVGFLIVLTLLVRNVHLAVTHIQARAWGWAIPYSIISVLLLIVALGALGFHS